MPRKSTIRPHRNDVREVTRDVRGRIKTNRRLSKGPTKSTRNNRRPWDSSASRELKMLARENTPTRIISLKLGRSVAAVRAKARSEGISLKPVNRSPRIVSTRKAANARRKK